MVSNIVRSWKSNGGNKGRWTCHALHSSSESKL